HFTELLSGYDSEQTTLDSEIAKLQSEIETFNLTSISIDKFIDLVKRHTEFTEFSAGLVNEVVEKIFVHEAVKIIGVRTQEIEIFFTFIGKFELPELGKTPPQKEKSQSTKILRRDMTEEQLARERERDRRRYAKKRDARLAVEQAQRADILQGTSFAI
ncbi:MAG: DUF4368 domain-containing protein, partial [Oscillospiraceae bacterium]|nr:DUF4368 domain-containing protein [Oscillospiraceae bacterium]